MNPRLLITATALVALTAPSAFAASIMNVVETGGDAEATDTIVAQWTGQTFPVSVANEPVPGLTVGQTYMVGTFASGAPAFVDRNHSYANQDGVLPIPAYLLGHEYIMSGNDNRDNATYRLDVTVTTPVRVFMLIDNRLSDGDGATPPTFGAANMQWILDEAWVATSNGLNRTASMAVPDEVPFDEGTDGDIDQYYSVYSKDYPAGTFALLQPDNGGRNMYGVVVQTIPEPGVAALAALGLLGLVSRRRR
jgi:hypothetical protein